MGMAERKIRVEPTTDGQWLAFVGSVGVDAATPWEASAAVYEALGEDIEIEWETLPWATLRGAIGIVRGVEHLLGASLEARRAIDAVRREASGVEGDCVACFEPAPWNARDLGWRWATCASGDPAWICPDCGAGDVDYEDGFPPPRWP
jgi:hypothetical protein